MKKSLPVALFLAFNFIYSIKIFACQCCYMTTTFCGVYGGSNVALVEVLNFELITDDYSYQEVLLAKVVDDLNGNIDQDTITILGNNGGNCVLGYYGQVGDTILYRLYQAQYLGNTVYQLGSCGKYGLRYEYGILFGRVIPNIDGIFYDEFVNNFSAYELYPRYFGIKGKVFSWINLDVGIPGFHFNINSFSAGGTDSNGEYSFPYVELIQNNEHKPIVPSSNKNLLKGITTLDLIKIRKHIIQIEELEGPCQRIAADINNSGTITTLDFILLKKAILTQATSFPNNQSWRFVDKNYIFPFPDNPWHEDFDAAITLNDCDLYAVNHLDVIAIKIGDVNGSGFNN